jgi:hypothetical protein
MDRASSDDERESEATIGENVERLRCKDRDRETGTERQRDEGQRSTGKEMRHMLESQCGPRCSTTSSPASHALFGNREST